MHQFLKLDKFEGADFKYQNFFQIPVQKYPSKAFLVISLRIFIFARNFAFRKFEGIDLKQDNGFFKFQPKFFVGNVSIFIFA